MSVDADTALRPFRLDVAEAAIGDLKARLSLARWPDEAPEAPWRYGTSVEFMHDLVARWTGDYDWRATEAGLNAWPQYVTRIDGVDVHFLHVEGRGPKPKPLRLSHGWPGSVLEFLKLIPLLTDPAAHGADAAEAFTVVAPSLPGYTLSFRPNQERKSLPQIGAMFDTLMTWLGYGRYAAQGGDWNSFVTAWPWPIDGRIAVPMGYCEFPREILRPPRAAAERVFDVRRWSVMPKGGHFAALEQPAALAHEIRQFFGTLE
jgi:pimeloyl-ACP methyl ester carboxylesterase